MSFSLGSFSDHSKQSSESTSLLPGRSNQVPLHPMSTDLILLEEENEMDCSLNRKYCHSAPLSTSHDWNLILGLDVPYNVNNTNRVWNGSSRVVVANPIIDYLNSYSMPLHISMRDNGFEMNHSEELCVNPLVSDNMAVLGNESRVLSINRYIYVIILLW